MFLHMEVSICKTDNSAALKETLDIAVYGDVYGEENHHNPAR